ncbi:MAG: ParB/RepB/Spo0J family partition protein [Clostridia bacterium]|nr:ParB/RepB/Spo0J family partition protein [Clostridia bacterium]
MEGLAVRKMKRAKRRKNLEIDYEKRRMPLSLIDTETRMENYDKKELKTRAAYFLLNGVPEFSVNERENGRFKLLAAERDFFAVKTMGATEIEGRIYRFTDGNAEIFSCIEKLKSANLGAMEEAYLMERLVKEFRLTQDDVAALIGKSRPAVANTMRLLTLAPEVVGLIESGKLTAGHARTLVRVPKEKQLAFAEEALRRGYSVREMERTVKAFLTPPEIMQKEKEAKAAAKSAELKAFVERMRAAFRTKVSLIGNDRKGRIYIDYYSAEDLYRFEELLEMIESYERD